MENEIIAISDDAISKSSMVKKLIDDYMQSPEFATIIKANDYFNGKNDVLKLDFRAYKANGIIKTNENRSNQKISNNYLGLLIEQLVDYVVGNGVDYESEDEAFTQYLDEKLTYDFDETVSFWLEESRIKGRSYAHFYYTKDGTLEFAVIPSEQVIPIYKDEFKKEIQEVVRFYTIPALSDGKQVTRKKVEWWDANGVKFFIEDDKGDFSLTSEMGHWTFNISTTPDYVEAHSWGTVPFVELRTGIRGKSDLQDIKGFIDAYDLLLSEFVNQLADIREILIKVLGYSGSSADEILTAFRGTGIVKIDDATGDIDVLKSEIPVEARQTALKILHDNIYRIGKGVDTNPEKYGTAVAGVAIKMMYKPLDMKADATILMLKKALNKFMWFLTDDYNRTTGSGVKNNEIELSFNKNTIEDVAAIIESSAKLKGIVSDTTIWERIPGVDPGLEKERMEEQEAKQLDEFNREVMSSGAAE